jgi:hypothetical protein
MRHVATSKLAITAVATVAALGLLLAGLALLVAFFFRFGLPPCAKESDAYLLTQLLLPLTCLASAIWLGALEWRPDGKRLLLALALPAAVALLVWSLAAYDRQAQRRCAAQTLPQAMASCHADPAVYRLGRDAYGNPILTLFAPGTTDRAHYCLWRWTLHNRAVSLAIDESVYVDARRKHAAATTPPRSR